jgi:hypothetical protein
MHLSTHVHPPTHLLGSWWSEWVVIMAALSLLFKVMMVWDTLWPAQESHKIKRLHWLWCYLGMVVVESSLQFHRHTCCVKFSSAIMAQIKIESKNTATTSERRSSFFSCQFFVFYWYLRVFHLWSHKDVQTSGSLVTYWCSDNIQHAEMLNWKHTRWIAIIEWWSSSGSLSLYARNVPIVDDFT